MKTCQLVFNPFKPKGISHYNQLDQSNIVLRVARFLWVFFFILIKILIELSVSKQWNPWSDAALSGSALFYDPQKSVLGINGLINTSFDFLSNRGLETLVNAPILNLIKSSQCPKCCSHANFVAIRQLKCLVYYVTTPTQLRSTLKMPKKRPGLPAVRRYSTLSVSKDEFKFNKKDVKCIKKIGHVWLNTLFIYRSLNEHKTKIENIYITGRPI